MTEVKIVPIFNQAAPGVWESFADINVATMQTNYNYRMDADERNAQIEQDIKNWRRGTHFAFGAYNNNQMIGFIQGDVHGRCATIQCLYVLFDWQGQRVGCRLLQGAERALSGFCSRIELVALTKAEPFYRRHGYSSQYGTNRYEKRTLSSPRCECLPIFRCNKALSLHLRRINPEFNADIVNLHHQPVFAYYDVNGAIVGYAAGEQMYLNAMAGMQNMVASVLRRKMEISR